MLDPYALRARLFPAMLVSMPMVLAALCWFPTVAITPIVIALFTWFGVGVLLAEFARDLGKRREPALWASWGGSPTVRRLRLRETAANTVARERWRALVAALAPDLLLPTADEETADPKRADDTYGVCIARLRELTRNTTNFPLLFQENISYGFRRNLWAMKPAGIFMAVAAMGVAVSSLFVLSQPRLEIVVFAAVIAAFMLTWSVLRITKTWVKEAAERYADQLLWSCEQLVQRVSAAAPTGSRVGF
ncbi:MAG: hypothetical protein M3Q69_12415 [Acidobacteriota bacterium]|nr:hypothetical protein [Acidobacteriota bacterium]